MNYITVKLTEDQAKETILALQDYKTFPDDGEETEYYDKRNAFIQRIQNKVKAELVKS